MEIKYQANDELVNLIIKKGWIEIFDDLRLDRKIGKRLFKKSKNSKGEIYFDYENIHLNYASTHLGSLLSYSEKEIDFFLNYASNSSLRKKLADENLSSFEDFKKIEKSILNRISLYSNIDSKKIKLTYWNKLIADLNYKN